MLGHSHTHCLFVTSPTGRRYRRTGVACSNQLYWTTVAVGKGRHMIKEPHYSISVSHNLGILQETERSVPEKWSLLDRNMYEYISTILKNTLVNITNPYTSTNR